MNQISKQNTKPQIDTMGGQAVYEGVLMRSPYGYAIAVRHLHNNEIVVKSVPYTAITKRVPVLGLPFLRGVATLFEMLIIGIKALNYSIREWEKSMLIIDSEKKKNTEEEAQNKNAKRQRAKVKKEKKKKNSDSTLTVLFAIVLGLVMAIFLGVVIPNLMTSYLGRIIPVSKSTQIVSAPEDNSSAQETRYLPSERSLLVEEQQPFLYNLIAGFFRATVLVGYVFAISFLKDIQRIFQYHGAEHKTVHAYERYGDVDVEKAREFGTAHPRCGTAFLAVVILVSIIVFAVIAQVVAVLWPSFTQLPFVLKKAILIGLHIIFLPVVAGSGYEIVKLASKYYDKFWGFRLLVLPGILFQKITTREPDDSQLEVAIASLHSALAINTQKQNL